MSTVIDEDELLTSLEHDVESCNSYTESEIGESRRKAYKYYYGKELGNEVEGRSQHVSMDVFDGVEAVKAMNLEVFTSNKNICQFDPENEQDNAEIATALANHIFYRDNPGAKILHDVIHDGLVAKVGVVKRYYKEDYEYEEEEFELDEASFSMLGADPDIEVDTVEKKTIMVAAEDVETGESIEVEQTTYSGTVLRKINTSKICIEVIPPENFDVDPSTVDLRDTKFCSVKQHKTKGELLAEGYPLEKVERLDQEIDEDSGRDDIDGYRLDDWDPSEDERQFVDVRESYRREYREDLNKNVLVKYIHSKRVLLDTETVSAHPFLAFTPIPIPHKFYGLSLAELLFDVQYTNSGIKRGIADNIFMTNTTRMVGNLSLVKNPRDLLSNKSGAFIDVNAPDPSQVVKPLQVPQLNAASFQALEMMDTEKEARSGASRMSRGMDSSVVSKQNSSDLITQFMNASNRRVMMIAKHLAAFVEQLLVDCYNLSIDYEPIKSVHYQGATVDIQPATLGKRTKMSTDVALTPDDQIKEAQFLLSLDQQFSMNPNDPAVGGLYGPAQRHSLLTRAAKLMNVDTQFLLNPSSPEYQQQQQAMAQQQQEQAQAQAQQQDINNQVTFAQLEIMKAQQEERDARLEFDLMKEQNQTALDTAKQSHKEEIEESDQLLKVEKQDHEIKTEQEEIRLKAIQIKAEATKDLSEAKAHETITNGERND